MSIYAVPLSKWFAKDKDLASTCRMILKYNHCTMCGGKCPFKTAIADHSLPWGYYRDIFCTQRCEKEYNKLVDAASNKVTIKLDKKGRFSIEKLRPLLGDKTDTIIFYTVKTTEDGSIMLQLFDEEGNKV